MAVVVMVERRRWPVSRRRARRGSLLHRRRRRHRHHRRCSPRRPSNQKLFVMYTYKYYYMLVAIIISLTQLFIVSLLPSFLLQPRILHDHLHPLIILPHRVSKQHRRFTIRRRIWIRIAQQTLYRRQHRGNVVNWRPLVLQNIQANRPVRVYVRMEHLRRKLHRRRFVRVLLGKLQRQFKRAAFPRRVFGPEHDRVPEHDIRLRRRARNPSRWVRLQSLEISNETFARGSGHDESSSSSSSLRPTLLSLSFDAPL